MRPELTSVVADVTLPAYLGRPGSERKDVRGGAVTLVKGSKATFAATASRDLAEAQVDGQARTPEGMTVTSPAVPVDGTRNVEFRWQDKFGLAGKEPFTLAITGRDDEPPTLTCEDLPRQKVVLDSEQLGFQVKAQDDFGVKRIGIEWQGVASPVVKNPAKGERVLAAGGNDKESLEVAGTFSAKSLGIEPQPVQLRLFAEDYLPGRPRIYSPVYTLYVLNAEQHAIWLTEQLSKWHRQAMEVRDRELQLNATNKQLRALTAEELDRPETRRKIENQAAAEQANGRRLSGLVTSGEDLVRQAMRNPEFGVGHLEKWAEMLQVFKDIAGNRMPSVADLLKQASQAPALATEGKTKGKTAMAGQVRGRPGGRARPSRSRRRSPRRPSRRSSTASRRSSRPTRKDDKPAPSRRSPRSRRLTLRLPMTTLAGKASDEPKPAAPAAQKVDEAVVQQDLLAEFEKVADELNRVLANLEGSTLVKRLKAASRLQYKIGGRIGDQVGGAFGIAAPRVEGEPAKVFDEMARQEAKGSLDVSFIMDDLQSYFERRRFMQFKTVLEEMRSQDVVGSLRQLGDDLKKETGVSIAQCEFWSDTLDRWADDLVDPSRSGQCPGGKSRSSLPPSVVLEVLQILEGEVNLREETRVAQQARPALERRGARQAGRQALRHPGRPPRARRKSHRPHPRAARRRGRVRLRDRPARPGLGRDGRGDRDPRAAGDRQPRDRGRDRGDRAPAQIEADQPEGGRRGRLDPWRRRHRHHERLGPRPRRRRAQRQGSPRGPRRLAVDRRRWPLASRRVPRRARRILQPPRPPGRAVR